MKIGTYLKDVPSVMKKYIAKFKIKTMTQAEVYIIFASIGAVIVGGIVVLILKFIKQNGKDMSCTNCGGTESTFL
jgi:hypothetical protein